MNYSYSKGREIRDLLFALLFLFFIQQLTMLVESIYMLNLLHTRMDARALGILLLLLPVGLYFVNHNKSTYTIIVALMLLCMFLSLLLTTAHRIFSAGIGAGLFLVYLPLQLTDKNLPETDWGLSAALATLISILLRVAGNSLDVSISGNTKFIGWFFILVAGALFYLVMQHYPKADASLNVEEAQSEESYKGSIWLNTLGLAGCIVFIYFAFSSPGVMVRWTEGNYTTTHILLIACILVAVFFNPKSILSSGKAKFLLLVWNGLFLFFFIWNILLHRVDFPSAKDLTLVIVEGTRNMDVLVFYQMLIFSPVIFMNIRWFASSMKPAKPATMALPFVLLAVLIIVCIFMLIFTNTWGYVGSLSRIFRNQFHLPFAIAGIFMLLPYLYDNRSGLSLKPGALPQRVIKLLAVVLALLSCGIILLDRAESTGTGNDQATELTLMTYNIQQGVDLFGNKNFEGQLERIREINPDVLCLQESDASRISGGNSDVVRYLSRRLGFHSYYGPKTVTGTYGTAILSRFPLKNRRTIFTYSSKDEIGTAVAEISVAGHEITIINSHPAGNELSRNEHIDMVVSLAKGRDHVIAMGDYNFRQDSPYYQKITTTLQDSWLSVYPDAVGSIDMQLLQTDFSDRKTSSGLLLPGGKIDMKERIDHIFLSKHFEVKEAHYLPAPESGTDHPLHWVVIRLKD